MTPLHQAMAIGWLTTSALVAAGLVARGRWKLSGFFAAYIGFGLVTTPMYLFWPEQFFHQWFSLIVQAGLDALKFGIAIEAAWRTFRPFPGARRPALLIALIVVVATAVAASAVPVGADAWEWEVVTSEFFPRISTGTIWVMTAVLVLARWYRAPVHPFHVALLTSFVAYLGVSGIASVLSTDGSGAFHEHAYVLVAVDMGAELILRSYWVHAAWRPDTAMVVAHGQTLRKLEAATALTASTS